MTRFGTFWGKLTRHNVLVTSEGSLHNVLHEERIPENVYGFFFVEKRSNYYLVHKFLNGKIMDQMRAR